jgi:hypothetical protein
MHEASGDRNEVELLGRYVILEELYRDEMVQVNRAFETLEDGGVRTVALKRLRSRGAPSFDGYLSAASYDHPNISRVCDYGRTCETYFVSTEFVQGHSLKEIVEMAWTAPPIHIVTLLLQQLCDALQFFHRKDQAGLGRLNLDPATLVLSDDGLVHITDTASCFPGVGRGHAGHLVSLGEVAYELLCLSPAPTRRDNREALRPSSTNPACPPALDAMVIKALMGEFESAGEMLGALVLVSSESYERPTLEAVAQWQRSLFKVEKKLGRRATRARMPRPCRREAPTVPGKRRRTTHLSDTSIVAKPRSESEPKTLIRMPGPVPAV